jgi:hypothetical protein
MPKVTQQKQLELEDFAASNPVSDNSGPRGEQSKPKRKGKTVAAISESQQPFLPGLSRRGRPRSENPIPATIRASLSRKRRTEAGVMRVELLLEPSIAEKLVTLTEHYKISRVDIVSRLIAQAAKRIIGRK